MLLAQLHVERAERLVEEQRRRPVHERARQRDALLLAAGELPRPPSLQALEPDDVEELEHPLAALAARHPLQLQPERDVVVDRHVRKERVLLEDHVDRAAVRRDGGDVLSLQEDATLVGHLEAGDHPERRRLPAAARAEQREELAVADRDVDVAHRLGSAEPLADPFEGDGDVAVFARHRRRSLALPRPYASSGSTGRPRRPSRGRRRRASSPTPCSRRRCASSGRTGSSRSATPAAGSRATDRCSATSRPCCPASWNVCCLPAAHVFASRGVTSNLTGQLERFVNQIRSSPGTYCQRW